MSNCADAPSPALTCPAGIAGGHNSASVISVQIHAQRLTYRHEAESSEQYQSIDNQQTSTTDTYACNELTPAE